MKLSVPLAVLLASSSLVHAQNGVTVVGWGDNLDDTLTYVGEAIPPIGLTNIAAISAGGFHSLALNSDGTVVGWGANSSGESTVPAGVNDVIGISSGYFHSLAVSRSGTVAAWGSNVSGETMVPFGLSNVVSVAAGGCDCLPNGNHSLALKNDGTVIGWGQTAVPAGLSNIVAIAAGNAHSLALKADGTIIGWDFNFNGQATSPPGLTNVVAISAGGYHSLALKSDGTVIAWGNNSDGQIDVPAGLSNVVAISAGENFSLALRKDGTVVAWGSNIAGETIIPTGLSNVCAISAGARHCLAIVNDGSPFISHQPLSQNAYAGTTVVLNTSVVSPSLSPLSLQWQHNGANVSGATNSVLVLTKVQPIDDGTYILVASNAVGTVTSAAAIVAVSFITSQPASQTVGAGTDPAFSVGVSGSQPFEFLWYFDSTNLVQSGTNSTLMLPGVSTTQSGTYTVIVTNVDGSETSQVATLTVVLPPSLTTQPGGLTVFPGTNANLQVTATGIGPLNYQWQFNGSNLPNNIVTTVAGTGTRGYSGDGGVATNATLDGPTGIASDGAGNLYVGDYNNNCVRKVSINGTISTVAGNTVAGFSGDGGAATNASLSGPQGLALDAAGNLFIADYNNYRIRKVDTNGIITTVAGNGTAPLAGDGGVATNASLYNPSAVALDAGGNLYIADLRHSFIRKVDTNGIITTVAGNGGLDYSGDGGAATNAGLDWISGLAFDPLGDLYISDTDNYRVRELDTNGIITTVAGNGTPTYSGDGVFATNATLNLPDGLAFDIVGNLYIADTANNRIRQVDTNGIITTVAGNGKAGYSGDGAWATNATLNSPSGVALDGAGNVFLADTYNNRIRKVLPPGAPTLRLANVSATNAGDYTVIVTSPYGSVTSIVATLIVETPPAITIQPSAQKTLLGTDPTFTVSVVGSGPFGYLWYFDNTNLVQSSTNTLTLSSVSTNDAGSYRVVITNAYGSVTSQVATLAVLYPPSITTQPVSQTVSSGTNLSFSVAVAGDGPFEYQWQLDGTNLSSVKIITVAGNGSSGFSGDGTAATNASLRGASDLTLDPFGKLYFADTSNNRIRKVNTDGIVSTVAGSGSSGFSGDGGLATNANLRSPSGVVLDTSGNLYFADTFNNRIRKVDTNGIISTVAGRNSVGFSGDGGFATNASLNQPHGLAFDALGNLHFADTFNRRVRKVDTNGIISTVAGAGFPGYSGDGGPAANANLNAPEGVSFDASGELYIADFRDNRVRKVSTNGIISTVAGNGNAGYSGDGAASTNASLNSPYGVAFDVFANLYIGDVANNRIRKVDTNGIITTIAGGGSTILGDGGLPTNASLNGPSGVAFDAASSLYIADSNNNRIRKVVLPDSPTLILTNVSANNAGNYTVVITTPYGSVTSAVAVLTVTVVRTPPQILVGNASFGFLTNHFGFDFSGVAGQNIVIDGSTDLKDWSPLFTNVAGNNPIYFFDSVSTNFARRFYRARLP